MKKIVLFALICAFQAAVYAQHSGFYFTTSDSVKLYVRIAGKGQPCVFLHGGPGSTDWYFEALRSAVLLEQRMQMIYFDQRGSGRSGSPANGDYSIARFEKDLEEIRNYLHIGQWIVMGHSFAGTIMTPYAHDYPKSVKALMYINCTLNLEESFNSHIQNGAALLGIKDIRAFLPDTLSRMQQLGKVHQGLNDSGIWYKLMYRSQREKEINDSISSAIGEWNRDFANHVFDSREYWQDFTVMTKNIKCPVFVMTGTKDYAVGPDHYKLWNFPNLEKVAVYDGGHVPFQEEPLWFAREVEGWLKRL